MAKFDMPALYHSEPNMFSLKPLIVLNEKRVEFDDHYVDFATFEHSKVPNTNAIVESEHNPEGEGPVLVHAGTAMSESFFICLYLDEAFPEPALRPADAYGRWRVLAWARFVNEVLEPAVSTLGAHKYLAPALAKKNRAEVERAIGKMRLEQKSGWRAALDNSYTDDLLSDSRRKLNLGVKKVEDALANSDWLVDGGYSLADINAFAILHPAQTLEPSAFAETPRIAAWLDRIRARPAVRAALGAGKTKTPETAFTPGPEHSRWG